MPATVAKSLLGPGTLHARIDELKVRVKSCCTPSTSATYASVFPSGDHAGDP